MYPSIRLLKFELVIVILTRPRPPQHPHTAATPHPPNGDRFSSEESKILIDIPPPFFSPEIKEVNAHV